MRTALAAILACCIACVGCQREPEAATPTDELTVSELEELLRRKKSKIEELTDSELEELLRRKKSNTTKAQPAVKEAEPLSPEPKPGSYTLKPPPKNPSI